MSIQPSDPHLEASCLSVAFKDLPSYLGFGLCAEDFMTPLHKVVASAISEIGASLSTVSIPTLERTSKLAGHDLSELGGEAWYRKLLDSQPANLEDAAALKSMSRMREMRACLLDAAVHCEQADRDGANRGVLDAAAIATTDSGSRPMYDAPDLCAVALRRLRDGQQTVYPGMHQLQQLVGGLPVGGMTILGGSTNVGKSSMCLSMMLSMAQQGTPVGYVSLEDSEDIVGPRLLAHLSGISARRMITRDLSKSHYDQLSKGVERAQHLKGKLLTEVCIGGDEVAVEVAMTRLSSMGCKAVFVDYVQAIECTKRQQDRRNEVRYVATRLKAAAARLGIALVLVSQLSRPAKGMEHKEPTKYDLKEAGDLENAAELILLIWRDETADLAPIHVKLEKGKSGGIGTTWDMIRDPETAVLVEASCVPC